MRPKNVVEPGRRGARRSHTDKVGQSSLRVFGHVASGEPMTDLLQHLRLESLLRERGVAGGNAIGCPLSLLLLPRWQLDSNQLLQFLDFRPKPLADSRFKF